MNWWNDLKTVFGKLSLLQMATAELADAELRKMAAHTQHEHAAALIGFETTRIKRLKAQINELSKDETK